MTEHHCDVIFRIRLKSGACALAYVLFEHKSSSQRATRLQLQRYIIKILTKWYDGRKEPSSPIVVPIVAHHSPGGWKSSPEFIEYFGDFPEALRPYLTSFRHALVDLASFAEGALSVNTRLNWFLMTMKYIKRPDMEKHLGVILVGEMTDRELGTIINYIIECSEYVSMDSIRTALSFLNKKRPENIMTLADKLREEGRALGRAEGLVELLEVRFGKITQKLRKRITASDIATLKLWSKRAIAAEELHQVFEA